MNQNRTRVCPVELSGSLDNRIRRWLQNPHKILGPYIREGMTILDLGCGPGYFSLPMAEMTGQSGRVIACDLQEGMLQKVKDKIQGTELAERIVLKKCEKNNIIISEKVDFILAFYVIHEIPDHENLFKELKSILKSNGLLLIVEPKLFHVSAKAFAATFRKAVDAGLIPIEKPKVFFSQSVLLKNDQQEK